MIISLEHASTARSHSRSGSRSPAFAKPMMARDCLAWWIVYAPVMEGLDGKFECDAQETCGLWIEPLPVKILSDRHQQSGPWKWGGRRWGHPSGLAAKFAGPPCLGSFMVPKITAVCLVSDVIVRILGASAATWAKCSSTKVPCHTRRRINRNDRCSVRNSNRSYRDRKDYAMEAVRFLLRSTLWLMVIFIGAR